MGSERLIATTETVKHADITTLSLVESIVDANPGSYLVLTGSYATEALTGAALHHADIDVNVFTPEIGRILPKIAGDIGQLDDQTKQFVPYVITPSRLEYDVFKKTHDPRRLELQFVEYSGIEMGENGTISFHTDDDNVVVPTVSMPIPSLPDYQSHFRVKSLPYLIATWVIRVSGGVTNEKRSVRDSDLEHLDLLMQQPFSLADVIACMNHHPQMPGDGIAMDLIHAAREKIELR